MSNLLSLGDEALILLAREGKAEARNLITERYFKARKKLAKRASYSMVIILSDWDLNYAFFTAFENCFETYRFKKIRFETYFLQALRHEMRKEAEKQHLFNREAPLSLDNEVPGSDGEFTFHDVLPSACEDPRLYVNYLEEAHSLGKITSDLDTRVLRVARLRINGLSYREIADATSLSPKQAKTLFTKYEKYVEEKIKIGHPLSIKGPAVSAKGKKKNRQ